MTFSSFSSGAVMFQDRVFLRIPEPVFYQMEEYPPTARGLPIQFPPPSSLCDGRLLLPGLFRMAPRPGPKFYLTVQGNVLDFLYGSFVGVYLGYQLGYLQQGVDLEILKHTFMGTDGNMDVGGSWRIWGRWLWRERSDAVYIAWRIFVYGMAGGVTQTLMRVIYRWLCNSDGHLIPALATYTIISIGEDNFYTSYRILGNLLYYTAIFEAWMMMAFRASSTYWVRHFLDRYIIDPFRYIHRPRNWLGDVDYDIGY